MIARRVTRVLAVLALLSGTVFFFQGIGVLPGSFMTGRAEWAYIGASLVGVAVLVLWLARPSRSSGDASG